MFRPTDEVATWQSWAWRACAQPLLGIKKKNAECKHCSAEDLKGVILEIRALVVFSRAIVNLHLPDLGPGDAVSPQRRRCGATRWDTLVNLGCVACVPSQVSGRRKEQAQYSTEAHRRHGKTIDCRPFSPTSVSTRLIRLFLVNCVARVAGTREKPTRSSLSGFRFRLGITHSSREQCHLVSQAMGSATVAEPMLRQTDQSSVKEAALPEGLGGPLHPLQSVQILPPESVIRFPVSSFWTLLLFF